MSERRLVTPLTKERAFKTIQVVAKAAMKGEDALSYPELAQRLGMTKVNGQGLTSYLNEAAAMCVELGLPNVSTLVVSKPSPDGDMQIPSKNTFANGRFAGTGLTPEQVVAEQQRVRDFDWLSVKSLGL